MNALNLLKERAKLEATIEQHEAGDETEAAYRSFLATALTTIHMLLADAKMLGLDAVTDIKKKDGFVDFLVSASLVRLAFELSDNDREAAANLFCALEEVFLEGGINPADMFTFAAKASVKKTPTTPTSTTAH